jgi:type IV secretion system protein VirB2
MKPIAQLSFAKHSRSAFIGSALALALFVPGLAVAQGFDKINTTVLNVNTILVTISIAVVTIAIIWAGFKMIFQGARLADVANVLIGGTLVGGAAAFAGFIVT